MNSLLSKLQLYPFEKWRQLIQNSTPNFSLKHINLGIGEPKHATPDFLQAVLSKGLNDLATYPSTIGQDTLRQSIANWVFKRYEVTLDASTQILPVNGSREALFAFAQAVVDASSGDATVISPNPFYQIYEGAGLLANASLYFLNLEIDEHFKINYESIPEHVLEKTQLMYVCSPSNPTGAVMGLDEWRKLFELADKYNFIIASDECYSEIYLDENNPPLGALQACHLLGRDFKYLVVFASLSKRSNLPGLRSGFVAGDADILKLFLLYRTYHGCAMSPLVQTISTAAWQDENHVLENRRLYQAKFKAAIPILQPYFEFIEPNAGFYLWLKLPKHLSYSDTQIAYQLYEEKHVTVLPGSYLAREFNGINPGLGYLRLALVADIEETQEAILRIADFMQNLS